jgi:hypothetical protein
MTAKEMSKVFKNNSDSVYPCLCPLELRFKKMPSKHGKWHENFIILS